MPCSGGQLFSNRITYLPGLGWERFLQMRWTKLGRVASLLPSRTRATTHMQVPAPVMLGSIIRVYFAARDPAGRSYPAFFDVSRSDPTKVIHLEERPILERGPPGTFDDEGIMPACVVENGQELWMYYSGWNRRLTIPYHNTTGIAVSRDGGMTFTRMFDGPVLERTATEPYIAVTPWVTKAPDFWRMWYVSGTSWERVGDKFEPVYTIKYANSSNGIAWERPNIECFVRKDLSEACAHPTLLKRGSTYHMWFSFRGTRDFRDGSNSYRIGYATSQDGKHFQRDDKKAGIEVSTSGWDSSMLCYPSVVEVDGQILMFYNGNSFGQTGVGCAILDGDLK